MTAPAPTVVRFLKPFRIYNGGEVAGFPLAEAQSLIDNGIAQAFDIEADDLGASADTDDKMTAPVVKTPPVAKPAPVAKAPAVAKPGGKRKSASAPPPAPTPAPAGEAAGAAEGGEGGKGAEGASDTPPGA